MRSELRRLGLIAALLGAACDRGVDDLTLTSLPLAYLHGHVDLASLPASTAGAKLRAALVWGAVPSFPVGCLEYGTNPSLQDACPDRQGFYLGPVESEVELQPGGDGRFEIPIWRLPSAGVSVGSDEARIAWGSVVVAIDGDGDGVLRLDDKTSRFGPSRDKVVAASFVSTRPPHQRVGFREGGWNEASPFYPVPGCPAPPPGFSILSIGGEPPACSSARLEDDVVEAAVLTAEEAQALACRGLSQSIVSDPRNQGEAPWGTQVCLDAQTVAAVESRGACASFVIMPLAGCYADLRCDEPDWDLRATPPSWWPCTP